MGTSIPDGDFTLRDEVLDALPIIEHVTSQLGLNSLLDTYVAARDPRVRLDPARCLSVVVANLSLDHAPLYALREWASTLDASMLGLVGEEVPLLNDDRVGRALGALFDADRSTLLNALVLRAVQRFMVDVSELHNDSTSIVLHGAYRNAVGLTRGGKSTVIPARGHSKDHRPDLLQLVYILTVTGDGAVPVVHRVVHGNTEDSTTHIETWNSLCSLFDTRTFLYVADSKLATRENMDFIDAHHGRFVSVLARTRKEDQAMRDWLVTHEAEWTEAFSRPGRRVSDAPTLYETALAPWPSAEGYRVIWCRSSAKIDDDAERRRARIAAGLAGIDELNQRLFSPKTRMKDALTIEAAARGLGGDVLSALGGLRARRARRGARATESRGRPGNNTRYRRVTRRRHHLRFFVHEDLVAADARSDGCWPLVTNDRTMSDAELLVAYKRQPALERRHHQLKNEQFVAPMFLRDPARIEGLMACQFIALLVRALVELLIRRAMVERGITDIGIYPEGRPSSAPSAQRVFELFKGVTRHHLIDAEGHLVQTFSPTLTKQQLQVIDLLGVSADRYR